MDLTQYKTNQYASSESGLSDYPSDEGYTAEQLKTVLETRSDGEIKNRHNGLVDALISVIADFTDYMKKRKNPPGVTAEQAGVNNAFAAEEWGKLVETKPVGRYL